MWLPSARRDVVGFQVRVVLSGTPFLLFFEFWWMKPLQKRPIILKIQFTRQVSRLVHFGLKSSHVDRRDERNNNGKTTALDMDDGGGLDELSLLAIRLSSQKSVAPLMHSLLSQNE